MTSHKTTYDYIVLGAGVAGLSFAHEVAKAGASVLVLEKEDSVGGLCRTLKWKNFKFDFSTHRLSGKSEHVLNFLQQMLGDDLLEHRDQKSRISLNHQFMRYPFSIPDVILKFRWHQQLFILTSYFYARIKNLIFPKETLNYKQWFCQRYGNKLYEIMCHPYTSKIWKCDPQEISPDWAERRFPQEHLGQLLIKIFKNDFLKRQSNIAPDTGIFYYPRYGFQQIPEVFEKGIKHFNQTIHTNATLQSINTERREVSYQYEDRVMISTAKKAIITTIPLQSYFNLLPNVDKNIYDKAHKLKYLDIIFVFFLFNRPRITQDHWLYFADHDIIFNRSVEFKNWSEEMAPKDQTSLCVDITCSDKSYWNLTDEEIKERCIEGLERSRIAREEEIADIKIVRVPYAYPVYNLDYKRNLEQVVEYIEKDRGIYTLGRTGMFRYNNSHYSIEMGMELAQRLLRGDNRSIHDHSLKNSV